MYEYVERGKYLELMSKLDPALQILLIILMALIILFIVVKIWQVVKIFGGQHILLINLVVIAVLIIGFYELYQQTRFEIWKLQINEIQHIYKEYADDIKDGKMAKTRRAELEKQLKADKVYSPYYIDRIERGLIWYNSDEKTRKELLKDTLDYHTFRIKDETYLEVVEETYKIKYGLIQDTDEDKKELRNNKEFLIDLRKQFLWKGSLKELIHDKISVPLENYFIVDVYDEELDEIEERLQKEIEKKLEKDRKKMDEDKEKKGKEKED